MPTESNAGCCESVTQPEMPVLGNITCLTKQRYLELVQLGVTASQELTKHGLKRNEYCEFGRIMEKIMQLE